MGAGLRFEAWVVRAGVGACVVGAGMKTEAGFRLEARMVRVDARACVMGEGTTAGAGSAWKLGQFVRIE